MRYLTPAEEWAAERRAVEVRPLIAARRQRFVRFILVTAAQAFAIGAAAAILFKLIGA